MRAEYEIAENSVPQADFFFQLHRIADAIGGQIRF